MNYLKPLVIENEPEEAEALLHPVGGLVLGQHLVVLAHGRQEQQEDDVREAVDPFLPLAPLTSHVDLIF